MTLRDLLELWGHVVDVAHDGQAAIEKLADQVFDLALVDVGLPRLDGYGVAKAVRELERSKNRTRMRLVALTGYGQPEDRKRALESGFDSHRTKPLESHDLKAVLGSASAALASQTAQTPHALPPSREQVLPPATTHGHPLSAAPPHEQLTPVVLPNEHVRAVAPSAPTPSTDALASASVP